MFFGLWPKKEAGIFVFNLLFWPARCFCIREWRHVVCRQVLSPCGVVSLSGEMLSVGEHITKATSHVMG